MNKIKVGFRKKVISMTTLLMAACMMFLAVPLVSAMSPPAPAHVTDSVAGMENYAAVSTGDETSGTEESVEWMAVAADGAEAEASSGASADVQKFGLIAAAIAFGFGAIGAGIAIANVGAAAMGAIGEKPELASQALIFIALAEGLVVFGFITALMILGKI